MRGHIVREKEERKQTEIREMDFKGFSTLPRVYRSAN